jgi:tetratricopeptide (TPR) repeat protein
MKQTKWMTLIIAVSTFGMMAGCDSQAQNRQAAVERWEKSSAAAKLTTVENLIDRGQIAEAQKTLEKCLQADPDLAAAHFQMGRVHLIESRNSEAHRSFERATVLDDTLDSAWFHLGVVFALDGDNEQALIAYKKAMTLKPANSGYIIAIAEFYLNSGQIDTARELLEEKLHRQPRDRDLLVCMAEVAQRAGELDKTTGYYEQALVVNAKDQQVLEALGYCYAARKDWVSATRTFERLLLLVTEDSRKETVLETLAMCAFNAGRYGQALSCYDKLTVMRRDDAEIWLNMAQAALGADLAGRADYAARKALQLKPSWPEAYAVLGCAQYLQSNFDGALGSFTHVCNDDQIGAFAWFMTGRCYARLGQTANAEAAYQKAGSAGADSPLLQRFLKEPSSAL